MLEFYDRWWKRRISLGWRGTIRQERLSKYSISQTKPNTVILDVGSGDGEISHPLIGKGCYVVGVDISPVAAKESQKRRIDTVLCDLRRGLPFVDKSFHATLLFDILEHLFQPEITLEEARRVTSESILINIPNPQLWVWRLQYFRGHIPYPFRSGHVQWWTLKGFIDLLENLSMKVSDISYMVGHIPFEKLLARLFGSGLRDKIAERFPNTFVENFFFTVALGSEPSQSKSTLRSVESLLKS